jgi:cell division protease FtsH
MKKEHKFSLFYILLAVWAVLLIQSYLASMMSSQVIPYSQFLKLLKDGKVSEVAITANRIEGKMKVEGKPGDPQPFRTIRVDQDLSELLDKYQVTFKGEVESTLLRDLFSWVFPIILFFGIWYLLMKKMGGQQAGFMTLGKSKAKIYMENEIKITFKDAAGVDEAKQELMEEIEFLKNPGRFTEIGGRIPKGILLVGPPGTGKTLLAKAVAGESGVPFFSLSGSEFVEMFVGLGAARVRDLFEQAKQKAPCIIFIDELDALGKARGFGAFPGGGNDEREQTLNQLLKEMDGFDPKVGVILMAATNRPEILDPALLRPGRFDRHVLVDRPDKKGREEILRVHINTVKLGPDVDLEKLAAMTPGMVGADLANLVNEAALLAVRHEKKEVEMTEFVESIERVVAGLEKKNRLINPQERKIVAYHEVGHALVALSLPGTDPVQKISIIPRGIAALGYTMQFPTEDRFLLRKTEILNRIASLLGGRAAEEIIFGDVSTGAHNDLARATDMARSMVKEYGMSSQVGQVYFAREKRALFMEMGAPEGGDYSEATAELIDREIKAIIDSEYGKAKSVLSGKRDVLEKGATLLLQKEKIEGTELMALMDGKAAPAA